ncbi:MAG TPA: response regulator transcription factor [Firmicutes bacterium]|nr:response regulator transcription factor [Bacillota bacterium]
MRDANTPAILLVDDDENVLELLRLYLEKEGFRTISAKNGRDAIRKVYEEAPVLVVLDVMLPDLDGWAVLKRLRQEKTGTPIIMLTAKSEDHDKILGLELGADDYVAKPFNPIELVARVKAVLRRIRPADRVINYPSLSVSLAEYEVRVDNTVAPFTKKEIELLWVLASNPGRVFTREQLIQQVWGYEFFGDDRTIDVHIKRIREKLNSSLAGRQPPWRIKTVWGVGYKFELLE